MARTRTRSRAPLTRERILSTALALADVSGIQTLTMRKLAEVLGFEAMSLYNHVANKDDLLDGILDLVLAESEVATLAAKWDEAIRSSAVAFHDALGRHPWACALLLSPARIRPGRLRQMDALLGHLREGGFSADTTYHAYHVLDGYIFGFSLWQTRHTYSDEEVARMTEWFEGTVGAGEYPYLREHGEQHFTEGPHHDVSAFEFGLDLILDGLKALQTGTATKPKARRRAS